MGHRVAVGVQEGDGWKGKYRHWGQPESVLPQLWSTIGQVGVAMVHLDLDEGRGRYGLHDCEDWWITSEAPDPLMIEWVYALNDDGKLALFKHVSCKHAQYTLQEIHGTKYMPEGPAQFVELMPVVICPHGSGIHAGMEVKMPCGCWCYGHCAYGHVLVGVYDTTKPEEVARALADEEKATDAEHDWEKAVVRELAGGR